jgi:hypothetical protein
MRDDLLGRARPDPPERSISNVVEVDPHSNSVAGGWRLADLSVSRQSSRAAFASARRPCPLRAH